jgi:hypothetical protein
VRQRWYWNTNLDFLDPTRLALLPGASRARIKGTANFHLIPSIPVVVGHDMVSWRGSQRLPLQQGWVLALSQTHHVVLRCARTDSVFLMRTNFKIFSIVFHQLPPQNRQSFNVVASVISYLEIERQVDAPTYRIAIQTLRIFASPHLLYARFL